MRNFDERTHIRCGNMQLFYLQGTSDTQAGCPGSPSTNGCEPEAEQHGQRKKVQDIPGTSCNPNDPSFGWLTLKFHGSVCAVCIVETCAKRKGCFCLTSNLLS